MSGGVYGARMSDQCDQQLFPPVSHLMGNAKNPFNRSKYLKPRFVSAQP